MYRVTVPWPGVDTGFPWPGPSIKPRGIRPSLDARPDREWFRRDLGSGTPPHCGARQATPQLRGWRVVLFLCIIRFLLLIRSNHAFNVIIMATGGDQLGVMFVEGL